MPRARSKWKDFGATLRDSKRLRRSWRRAPSRASVLIGVQGLGLLEHPLRFQTHPCLLVQLTVRSNSRATWETRPGDTAPFAYLSDTLTNTNVVAHQHYRTPTHDCATTAQRPRSDSRGLKRFEKSPYLALELVAFSPQPTSSRSTSRKAISPRRCRPWTVTGNLCEALLDPTLSRVEFFGGHGLPSFRL